MFVCTFKILHNMQAGVPYLSENAFPLNADPIWPGSSALLEAYLFLQPGANPVSFTSSCGQFSIQYNFLSFFDSFSIHHYFYPSAGIFNQVAFSSSCSQFSKQHHYHPPAVSFQSSIIFVLLSLVFDEFYFHSALVSFQS